MQFETSIGLGRPISSFPSCKSPSPRRCEESFSSRQKISLMIFPINLDQGYPEKFWPSGAGNTNLEIFE